MMTFGRMFERVLIGEPTLAFATSQKLTFVIARDRRVRSKSMSRSAVAASWQTGENVARVDDGVDAETLGVLEHCLERPDVSVYVGDRRDSHTR